MQENLHVISQKKSAKSNEINVFNENMSSCIIKNICTVHNRWCHMVQILNAQPSIPTIHSFMQNSIK